MTDNGEPHASDPAPSGRHRAHPQTTPSPSEQADLGERTAAALVRMTTTAGQTVIDLDDDPTLRDAAHSTGRVHQAVDPTTLDASLALPGDLVVLRWPRPGDDTWLSTAPEVFNAVRHLIAPSRQVAVLLDPAPAHAYSITWTGTLLAAAADAGLPVLQDIVCVHDLRLDEAGPADAATAVVLRHRVILILRTPRGLHARP